MMAARRVPPQMMGIMLSNVGGFGYVEKASFVFVRNEQIYLQEKMKKTINDLSRKLFHLPSILLKAFNIQTLNTDSYSV